jgi:cell division protein FtsW
LGIFLFIAYRVFNRIYNEQNHFLQISLFALVIYFSLQALIHIAVNIRLIPATGMTLPFISYGGSSVIGISITFGLIMLLSKKIN